MNGRRTIVGLCMFCALLTSAFAAQSASAITGTTAVTCAKSGAKQVGTETFNTTHCKPGEGAGEFEHYEITENTMTELTGQIAGSGVEKLKATLGGVATTFAATGVTGTGTIENKVDENGEHFAHGSGKVVFTGVTISPFTKCFVYTDDGTATPGAQGVIDTEEMTATTNGQGMGIQLQPVNAEGIFKRFWILDKNKKGAGGECTISGTYLCSGSVIGVPEGSTGSMTHFNMTEQGTLKLGVGPGAAKAGIEGSGILEARHNPEDTFKPLSVTTVTT